MAAQMVAEVPITTEVIRAANEAVRAANEAVRAASENLLIEKKKAYKVKMQAAAIKAAHKEHELKSPDKAFALWLKRKIEAVGSIQSFAKKSGFCDSTIRNWSIGHYLPSTPGLLKPLAAALSDWTGELITAKDIWAVMEGDPLFWDN